MTLTDFKNTDPGLGNISMLRDDSDNISNITISRTDCNLTSYDTSLSQLTGLLIKLDDNLTVVVENVTNYTGYYHLEVTPFVLVGSLNEDICNTVTLTPFNENINIIFRNSVFNPTFNNVPENLTAAAQQQLYADKIEIRKGKTIYDVDRKNDAIVPTNIINILEDTANLAEFPESNYSSFANTTGRYLGSKTSILDFGVDPIIAATLFQGSVYGNIKTAVDICSQSTEARIVVDLLYTVDGEVRGKALTDYTDVRIEQIAPKGRYSGSTFTSSSTTLEVYEDVQTKTGDIIRTLNGSELMKVASITKYGTPTTSSIEVERNYYGNYIDTTPLVMNTGATLSLVKVIGDTIYSPESGKPYKVTNKKLWVQQTGDVLVTDTRGIVIHKELTCN